ncbi:MAG: hypothetical protein M1383_06185 [Patescibacteria group bacterium]|nr:hypothetical protein [Patescibacteria group bacterium]
MQKTAERRLEHIGAQIPQRLLGRAIDNKGGEEKEIVDDILKNKRVPEKLKKTLTDLRDNKKAFNTEYREENLEVKAELDRFVGKRVAHEIRVGRLTPADPNDPFLRKVRKLTRGKPPARERLWKPAAPTSNLPPSMRGLGKV